MPCPGNHAVDLVSCNAVTGAICPSQRGSVVAASIPRLGRPRVQDIIDSASLSTCRCDFDQPANADQFAAAICCDPKIQSAVPSNRSSSTCGMIAPTNARHQSLA